METYDYEPKLYDLINAAYSGAVESDKDKIVQKVKMYLNRYTNMRFISKGGKIFSSLDPVRCVYLILFGEYSSFRYSTKGQYNVLARRKGLQFLGLIEAINKCKIYEASITAISESIVVEIDKDYFIQQMMTDNRVAMLVINNLAYKLMHSVQSSDRHLFYDATDNLLIYLYQAWIEADNNKDKLKIQTTKEDIAQEIGINLRTVYRSIKELKERNLISIYKGKIVITRHQLESIKERISELGNTTDSI